MADYKSNKTCEEIDAILNSATPKGEVGDAPDVLTLQGARSYAEVLSKASLICAGRITALYTTGWSTIGAEVEIYDAFKVKYGDNAPTITKVVLVDKRVIDGTGVSTTRFLYSGDYEGCYFVMGDFEGNDTIFELGATKGDWIIAQNQSWAKIVTTRRDIAGIEGEVTAEKLVNRLSTATADNTKPLATKEELSGFVKGVKVNDEVKTPDTDGVVDLGNVSSEVSEEQIASLGFTKNKGTVTKVADVLPDEYGHISAEELSKKLDIGGNTATSVNFANDLTGRIEATPEMFTYRPSAGDKSVRDESAVIRRIKGNTSVWGQVANIKASITSDKYIFTRNADGSITIKRDPTITSGYWCALNMDRKYRNIEHKYMFYADVSSSEVYSASDYCQVSVYNMASETGNHKYIRTNGHHVFCCFGSPNNSSAWQFAFYAFGVAELTIHNLQCFDLTALFGAGNEPTTYEEFRQYYPDAYYPYCLPEVRAMRATGIETIGFNAFNGEYAEVIGGQPYYLGGAIDTAHFATEVGGESLEVTIPENRLYTPSTNGYIYATGSDICINLSHSGVRNGEYEEYEKNTLLLPEIAKYFPEGMHGIGGVFDEINEENAVKRFGVVDLGTLTWTSNGTSSSTGGLRRWVTSSIKSVFPTGANNMEKSPNMVCLKYPTGSINSTYRGELSIACGTNGDIFLFDPEYTSNADKDAFVASLQGVILYYELALPIYTPIDEILQLDYKVDDFGTERMLCDEPSSPFKADIVYQFNAEGRIRDNARDIKKLEDKLKSIAEGTGTPAVMQQKIIGDIVSFTELLPNIFYSLSFSIAEDATITIPLPTDGDDAYLNKWSVRLTCFKNSQVNIPFNVVWNGGEAPQWTTYSTVELTFTKDRNRYLGNFKVYR